MHGHGPLQLILIDRAMALPSSASRQRKKMELFLLDFVEWSKSLDSSVGKSPMILSV
jgi:hypothetical protein